LRQQSYLDPRLKHDLAETKAAAAGNVTKGSLAAGSLPPLDPDHDGTLTQDAYLAVVEQRLQGANSDADTRCQGVQHHKAGRARSGW
jgi:hypothetical protein